MYHQIFYLPNRLEYRNRIRKVTKVQLLWKARRDHRKEEEEKLRIVREHEVADP